MSFMSMLLEVLSDVVESLADGSENHRIRGRGSVKSGAYYPNYYK